MSMENTPVKKVINKQNNNINHFCRICGIDIRISGRGKLNIFEGAKSVRDKLAERLSYILQTSVSKDGTSSTICLNCKRNLERLEKATADLVRFKETAERTAKEQRTFIVNDKENSGERFKRCTFLDSPKNEKPVKRKACETEVRRNILQPSATPMFLTELPNHDDLFVNSQPRVMNRSKTNVEIIRGVANNERVSIANAVWDSRDLKDMIMCKIEKDVVNEFRGLCSRRNPSILANSTPHNVINITDGWRLV
ncbi:hypothetical protein AC249_AIPGENE23172 [Paramuricea clavata]|uniref:Uncharacterized protein n=1 Tax=Paramuricea clavata TaxID=317549 RepID=A0A6S7JVW6_PARCT|nr:hypothetical protein AC249_AIPGENE23172 [Paramuricea clavata]